MRSGAARIAFGALALSRAGSGVQTYIRELLTELAKQLPVTDLFAVVQRDAVAELPKQIKPIRRPVSRGAIRAVFGALPYGRCDIFHGLDVDIPFGMRAPSGH